MQVLIDGENFRHQITHILHRHKKISDKNAYFSFDFVGLIIEALKTKDVEIIYYTTRIRQPQMKVPVALKKRITAISEANRRWVADLTNQQITVVKAGHLRVRESSGCVHCSKKTLVLQEKGVDVRVATDLVLASQGEKLRHIVLGSSDSDLMPAIQAARLNRLKITYFCYKPWLNQSIASQAQKVITFDDELVVKHFRGRK